MNHLVHANSVYHAMQGTEERDTWRPAKKSVMSGTIWAVLGTVVQVAEEL